ncbi:MAG: DEAD/DEAH box helicase, partial [Desulfovibrionaceae bacterium]
HPALPGVFSHIPALYVHQEMVFRAVAAGRHPLVSTGTGSGKTESFLSPIINHCLHLRDENAEGGVAAVLVYPMNALVNDQLERLRTLLAGTRITFGRYTGETPEKASNINQLKESRAYNARELARHRRRQDALPLPWEECASREDIRKRKPRLLLTNYSQLEQLLLRDRDVAMFRSGRLRFFVLDEVHTYTGAVGSEVACLMRRLRAVAGKDASEILCIGSSATVTEQEVSETAPAMLRDFSAKLFGVDPARVQTIFEQHEEVRPEPDKMYAPPPPAGGGELLESILDEVRGALLAEEVDDVSERALSLAEQLCGRPAPPGPSNISRLYRLLAPNRFVSILQSTYKQPETLDFVMPG